MKKVLCIMLTILLLTSYAGVQQVSATVPTTAEPMPPETRTGIVQAEGAPSILCLLQKDQVVNVTEQVDEIYVRVTAGEQEGLVEKNLIRLAHEAPPEVWTGYARYKALFHSTYHCLDAEPQKLTTNTKLEVLDTLGDICMVSLEGTVGFVAAEMISKYPISGGGGNGGGGGSAGQDGGDISMAHYRLTFLSDVVYTGEAIVKVDGAELIGSRYALGQEVQIVGDEDFADSIPGYLTVYEDDKYHYLPEYLVWDTAQDAYVQWTGYARWGTELHDDYQLSGEALSKLITNTKVTVLWDGSCFLLVQTGDTIGYVSPEMVSQYPYSSGGGGSSGGSSGGDWTPPAL